LSRLYVTIKLITAVRREKKREPRPAGEARGKKTNSAWWKRKTADKIEILCLYKRETYPIKGWRKTKKAKGKKLPKPRGIMTGVDNSGSTDYRNWVLGEVLVRGKISDKKVYS